MRSLITRLFLVLGAGVLSASPGFAQDPSVEGAWLLSQVESNGAVDDTPLPGLFIFSATHYSMMFVSGDDRRADLGDQPTDAETVAAYGPFVANSGRYEIEDGRLTTRAYVAKYPNYMHAWPDNVVTFDVVVDGDLLVLTFGQEFGTTGEGTRFTLRRVEGMPFPGDE